MKRWIGVLLLCWPLTVGATDEALTEVMRRLAG